MGVSPTHVSVNNRRQRQEREDFSQVRGRCRSRQCKQPSGPSVASRSLPMRRGLQVHKNGTRDALLAQSAIRCWTAQTCKKRMGFFIARPATAASLARKGTAMGSGLVPYLTLDLGQIVNRYCICLTFLHCAFSSVSS